MARTTTGGRKISKSKPKKRVSSKGTTSPSKQIVLSSWFIWQKVKGGNLYRVIGPVVVCGNKWEDIAKDKYNKRAAVSLAVGKKRRDTSNAEMDKWNVDWIFLSTQIIGYSNV